MLLCSIGTITHFRFRKVLYLSISILLGRKSIIGKTPLENKSKVSCFRSNTYSALVRPGVVCKRIVFPTRGKKKSIYNYVVFSESKKNSNSCRCFLTPPLDGIDTKTTATAAAAAAAAVVVVVPEKKRRKMNH